MTVLISTGLWVVKAPSGNAVALDGSAAIELRRYPNTPPLREGAPVDIPGIAGCRCSREIYQVVSTWQQ